MFGFHCFTSSDSSIWSSPVHWERRVGDYLGTKRRQRGLAGVHVIIQTRNNNTTSHGRAVKNGQTLEQAHGKSGVGGGDKAR